MNKARKSVRQRLLDAIKKNGGYWRGGTRVYGWMLSWNVGTLDIDSEVEAVREYAVRIGAMCKSDDAPIYWDGIKESVNALSSARFELNQSSILKTARPLKIRAHGFALDILTFDLKDRGEMQTEELDVEVLFALQGKHLVIHTFEGHRLDRLDDVNRIVASLQNNGDNVFSNETARRLLTMIEEWDQCFTPEKASDAVMSNMACVYASRCSAWHTENEERQAWADRDVVTV